MLIKTLPVGHMEANCYIVTDESTMDCVIIDPGDESNTILDYIEDNGLKPGAILITHCHFDHTGAVDAVSSELDIPTYVSPMDASAEGAERKHTFVIPRNGVLVSDGDSIDVGTLHFKVIGTPGHSPGSVSYLCENAVFTGDTLFRDSCGRTDLPGGNMDELLASLRRLARLEGNPEVWPGHLEPTTMDIERENNYYMRYALGDEAVFTR